MRSDVFKLTGEETQRVQIISEVDRYSSFNGLERRDALRLRLLTEETLGMMPELLKFTEGSFWIENDGLSYELHVTAKTKDSGFSTRERLLSVSSDGTNIAEKGFMGKLRSAIEMMLYPSEEDVIDTDFCGFGYDGTMSSPETWSLQQYREDLLTFGGDSVKARGWDELEKSIVASLADNVVVSIRGKQAELIIRKTFRG